MTIKLSSANLLHALLITGQVLNYASGMVADKWKPVVAGGLALIQLAVGAIQQRSPVLPVAPK